MAFHPKTMTVAQGGTSVTSLTAHNLIVGNGSNTPNLVAPSATSGVPLVSNGASADPSYTTASVAGGGTGLTSLTAHNLIVGNGSSAATLLSPSATSGVPLISQGASADPVYGTAVVSGGGTGVTSNTAYAVLCGGTTSTGAIQSIASVGTSGQVLTSNGAGALPSFSTYSSLGFSVYANANLSNVTGDGTFYQVVYNTTIRNDGTMYNTGTGLVTIPRAGLWLFNAIGDGRGFTSAAFTTASMLFEINAGPQAGNQSINPIVFANNGQFIFGISILYQMSLNDTIAVRYTASGSTKTISLFSATSSFLTRFSGIFIG